MRIPINSLVRCGVGGWFSCNTENSICPSLLFTEVWNIQIHNFMSLVRTREKGERREKR